MKKIFSILMIALLGAAACNTVKDEPVPMSGDGDGKGKVTLVMGLELPNSLLATRGAMSTDPAIDNVYVAIFGGEGYLNDYAKAVPCSTLQN